MEDVKIFFEYSTFLVLEDCYYIPNFIRNLVYVGCLKRQGYYVSLDDLVFINMNNKIICYGWESNNLYFVQLKTCILNDTENVNNERNIIQLKNSNNDTYL